MSDSRSPPPGKPMPSFLSKIVKNAQATPRQPAAQAGLETKVCATCGAGRAEGSELRTCEYCGASFFEP